MSEYEKVEIVAPEGVTFTDGPLGPRATDGSEYKTYAFGLNDVPPEKVDSAKEELRAYYQRMLNGFCFSFGVTQIEWRTRPNITVHLRAKTKKKLSNLRLYSRFHAPGVQKQQDAAVAAFAAAGPLQ